MKIKLSLFLLAFISFSSLCFGWPSESGSGIVSGNTNYSASSVEATQVLQSDTLGLMYGENRFGGVTNYASMDSGGVLSFRNVASSVNKIKLNNADCLSWLTTTGSDADVCFNNSNQLNVPATIVANGLSVSSASFDNLQVNTKLSTSGDAVFVKASATSMAVGTQSVSSNTVGTQVTFTKSTFGTNRGLVIDSNGKIQFESNKPKRTIVLTGGGSSAGKAAQSLDTMSSSVGGNPFRLSRLTFSPFSVQDAYWSFVVPNTFTGTSVDVNVVWYTKELDSGTVSFDVQTARLSDNTAFLSTAYGLYGSVLDTFVASGNSMTTSTFSVPVSWVSGDLAIVRLQKNSTDAADTVSKDTNVVQLKVMYETNSLSD